jgi:hypothetical protein
MKAYVHTMKFQKCEEPHAHCLIILNDEYRIDTAEKIDHASALRFLNTSWNHNCRKWLGKG